MSAPQPDPTDIVATGLALIALAADEREDAFGQLLALIPRSEWPALVQVLARTAAAYARHLAEVDGIDPDETAEILQNVRSAFLLDGKHTQED